MVRRTSPRSYETETGDGQVFKHNRRHLLQTRKQCAAGASDDDDCSLLDSAPIDSRAPASSSAVGVTGRRPAQSHQQPPSAKGTDPTTTVQPVLATLSRPTLIPRRLGRAVKPLQRFHYD